MDSFLYGKLNEQVRPALFYYKQSNRKNKMPQVNIPAGIVRSLTLVTAEDNVVAIFVDGIRKMIGITEDGEDPRAVELIKLLSDEGFSSKVLHIQQYTCNNFYKNTCLNDPDIFMDICPELLQHLKVDQD